MITTLAYMAEALKENDAYRIYFHKKPDGDAIGSAHALALGLRANGAKCALYCCDPIPQAYRYLTEAIFNDDVPEDCPGIAVDSPSPGRLGKFEGVRIDFCVDHHENNRFTEALQYVEAGASSCAEVLLKLLDAMNISITKQIADLLYVGLVTDTMCFRTRSTSAATMSAAARLAVCGADIVGIARCHALMKSPQRMEIEGLLCRSFHYTCDNRVLGCMFSYGDMTRIGIDDSQLEGLNTVVEQVEGIEIGIVVRETRPGFCRVSVRTDAKWNAAAICGELGGGGHANSAGCELDGAPTEVLARVEQVCGHYLENAEQREK